ncbi:hypothetical protein DUNSADRAFT_10933 [Dunaliella salina]|uniref:Uncharacterized protein n=1 Tax=Dunaliella salina TaxID=3046 RepID=A0ABQ7GEH9_DUNSA|nr:hypothetical protein DUNSADRAFT_10933 [Dunaliella salina]|eukprot:KAF5833012.1 hypothetical protein DUNSADRAFT_10933 [Dunaliella salina]
MAINSASPSPVKDVCGSACMLGPSHPISPVGSGTADPGAAPGTTDWHAFRLQEQQQQHLVQTAPANTNSSEYKGSGAEGGCLWQQHHQHNHQQEQQHQQQQQQQQHHPGPLGILPLQIPIQGPLAQGSMAGRPSESVWQHIDVLTTPSLSGPELSLLLDALNSTS